MKASWDQLLPHMRIRLWFRHQKWLKVNYSSITALDHFKISSPPIVTGSINGEWGVICKVIMPIVHYTVSTISGYQNSCIMHRNTASSIVCDGVFLQDDMEAIPHGYTELGIALDHVL